MNRDTYQAVCRALSSSGVCVEPDPRFGGSLPSDDSTIILFPSAGAEADGASDLRYGVAALTLHLAVAVASADGQASQSEQEVLRKHLEESLDFTASERQRLDAHLRRLIAEPPKLTGLTKRIAALSKPARVSLGNFLALVAQADNHVSPEEVKTLEKVFKLLGLEPQAVYSSVHAIASEPVSVRPADGSTKRFAIPSAPGETRGSFKIDHAKVAALHADSARVFEILGSIFNEENPIVAAKSASAAEEGEPTQPKDSLLGLDAEHTAFLRTLLARSRWTRSELEEMSQDRGLLLDGALEHINEAAHEKFERSIFEGQDPVDLDVDILKEIADGANQAA